MKYTIHFWEGSTQDFEDGFVYYERISTELAERFYRDFKSKVDEVEKKPLYFQVRYRSIRIAHLSKFPFSLHFFIEGNTINVIKILHQKRLYR